MIGKLLSHVLGPAPAAAAPAPDQSLDSAPASVPPPPAAVPGDQKAEFQRIKAYEHSSAGLWLMAQQMLQALLADPRHADPRRLERHGWKAYSQNDEDGILQEIFRRIGVRHRSFVEFGCDDGLENNTAYLLAQGWRGLWIDGAEYNANMIRQGFALLLERGHLQMRQEFITRDNIDGLIAAAGLGAEIDLLSIDVDGNDYYLWEAIGCVTARVVVIEYNAKFRPPVDWRMAYTPDHIWAGYDAVGCSLSALERLGKAKGYCLVGCNLTGANAFFVREDLVGDLFAAPASAEHLFQPPRYDLIYAYRGGHGASSLAIVQGACAALDIAMPTAAESGSLVKSPRR